MLMVVVLVVSVVKLWRRLVLLGRGRDGTDDGRGRDGGGWDWRATVA